MSSCIRSRANAAGPSNRFTVATPLPGLPSLVSGSAPDTTSVMKTTPSTTCTPSTANSGRIRRLWRLGCELMPPQHMDRLSSTDASFLHQERQSSHMHVGALVLFDGPPLSYEELLEHVESRLHLVPRYRQKLAVPPFETGRPLWVDDPTFNLEYHARITALPKPGSEQQLRDLAGRIFSQRLDRSKPLWELWLVHGLEDGGFALISKNHHSMIDGVAGIDLASVLFDLSPVPNRVELEPWTAHPEPSSAELLATAAKDVARGPVTVAGKAVGAVRHPRRALGAVR